MNDSFDAELKEAIEEREIVRSSIVESLKLIVQSQMVLADLEVNQKRLEGLLHDLEGEDNGPGA